MTTLKRVAPVPQLNDEFIEQWFAAGCPPIMFGMAVSIKDRKTASRRRQRQRLHLAKCEVPVRIVEYLRNQSYFGEGTDADRACTDPELLGKVVLGLALAQLTHIKNTKNLSRRDTSPPTPEI